MGCGLVGLVDMIVFNVVMVMWVCGCMVSVVDGVVYVWELLFGGVV